MPLYTLLLTTVLVAAPLPQFPVEQYQLENGLTVLLAPDDRLPVTAVEVRYLVGSGHEQAGRTGFAHLFEHLMFQGTASYNNEYFAPFEPIGGVVNGTTSRDRTNYYERVPSNYLELSLWMQSDRMEAFLPALSQDKLKNQQDVVLNERRQRYIDEPYGMAWQYMAEELWPVGHPYHHTTIGDPRDIENATLDDVRAFYRQYYVPANAVVTIVGDFATPRAKELVQTYFGHLPGGQRAPDPKGGIPRLSAPIHVQQTDDVKLPRMYLAWPTPPLYAPGDAELDILSSVLTRGKTSRLFQPLVYEKKVAKDVASFQASQKLASYFVVMVTAAPGTTIEELHRETMAALRDALAQPITETELNAAVNHFKKGYFSRMESAIERAGLFSTYYHHAGQANYLAQDVERYTQATTDSVLKESRQWLDLDQLLRIDIVPGVKAGGAE